MSSLELKVKFALRDLVTVYDFAQSSSYGSDIVQLVFHVIEVQYWMFSDHVELDSGDSLEGGWKERFDHGHAARIVFREIEAVCTLVSDWSQVVGLRRSWCQSYLIAFATGCLTSCAKAVISSVHHPGNWSLDIESVVVQPHQNFSRSKKATLLPLYLTYDLVSYSRWNFLELPYIDARKTAEGINSTSSVIWSAFDFNTGDSIFPLHYPWCINRKS